MTARAAMALAFCLAAGAAAADVRIKDIVALQGRNDEQLVGYGLVVGLQGTGDTLRNAPFTQQSLQAMLDRLGVNVRGVALGNRNAAAVMVTSDLDAAMTVGSRFDVTVSALGDSSSLMGGTLLFTTLNGIDGTTHATAQGAVSVTGFEAAGQAETVTQGVPTVGRISNGAIVSRPMPSEPQQAELSLSLRNPDYATAVRVADAINAYSRKRFSRDIAREQNARSVLVARPRDIGAARLMAEIGALSVQPDTPARVVVDSRTGTVVIGQDVRISTVAVTHGTLTVRVTEAPTVSQPAPRSNGQTKVVPSTAIDAEQQGGPVAIVEGANLRSLVAGLNKIGLKPSGIIAILQAIKTAGALQADLVFQ